MTPHIISWAAVNERSISPISTTPSSVVSIDSISSESSLSRATQPRVKAMNVLGDREFGVHHANDDPFARHDKYFFKDGNITFLVDGTLYCVHRYFFSHHSTYFSTRLDQLGIREHEALPIIISLGDIERKDFEAFLSVLYPDDFDEHSLSYEQWKSVLHLSTLWGFASLRKLAMRSINPPTPFDQLLLARAYSVDHWILPALSELCERTVPLSLNEARQMNIEDVVLISTVREDIRFHALQVDSHEIPRCIEAAQAGMHAVAAGRHGAFASEGAKGETPTEPSSLSNGTDRSARSTTAAVANNMGGVGGENEEDARTAVASSPVDLKRRGVGDVGSHSASSVDARPSERDRSSRPNSAWGKILVIPSPTVSHSPSSSTWGTADPPESHDPPPAMPSGRVSSGRVGSVPRIAVRGGVPYFYNTDRPVEGDASCSDTG
ncbi:hypothetical protein BGY98DRAFT_954135 [Russula aff. rugulosa BPL654]|nr:hypothetical protein BGY98DRAFT_954135 [Russula aff. rugulosa BPL654]